MDIEVHRAGRAFYAQSSVLLNIPHRELDAFFGLSEWPLIVAAKFFGLPEVEGKSLTDFVSVASEGKSDSMPGLSAKDLDQLLMRKESGELTSEQLVAEMASLRQHRQQESKLSSPTGIAAALIQRSGVSRPIWERSGQEMLEAVIPLEYSHTREILNQTVTPEAGVARQVGMSSLSLADDFPILTVTYGYSRAEYAPNQCRLNPFPPEREHGGKFPIYVDKVQADALLLSLNPYRVHDWLERNGYGLSLPAGSNADLALRAHFVELFDDVPLRETLSNDRPEARLVFGLLHTLSHICIRQAALLCGLEKTSLAEYVLPRTLTFAVYCNHRGGATIGALTALFEQSLNEWLNNVLNARRCVYDPVCQDHENSCHACTHLPETSCRFFNLNLGRAFLFGGSDPHLGHISVGYFDPSLPT